MTIGCKYDVNQSNIKYSDVKQSVSTDPTITDKKHTKPSELEYEAIETDAKAKMKVDYDVNTVRLVISVGLIFRDLGSSDDFVGLYFRGVPPLIT